MIEIFKSIQDKIAAITVDNETTTPLLNYVDEDWGQLDDYGINCPVKWPCCLIDEQSESYSDMGMQRGLNPINRQQGTLTIVLTIANVKLTNTSSKAPLQQKQHAWHIKEIKERIHAELHGWAPVAGQGKLMRVSGNKVGRDDGVQQHRVFYSMGLNNV